MDQIVTLPTSLHRRGELSVKFTGLLGTGFTTVRPHLHTSILPVYLYYPAYRSLCLRLLSFIHRHRPLYTNREQSVPIRLAQCRFRGLAISVAKIKGSPYSIAERRVPELIPFLGSRPAGDVSHKRGGRLPLLSARPAVTLATLKRTATSFAEI